MNCYVISEIIAKDQASLQDICNKIDSDQIFPAFENESVEVFHMTDWNNRRDLYPSEPCGPDLSGLVKNGKFCAQRYSYYSEGEGGLPGLDNLIRLSANHKHINIISSYLYYDIDDEPEVGFVIVANGNIVDAENLFFNDNRNEFMRLSNIWLGWHFPG